MLVATDFLSSRDISHILWVVFTSMTVKILNQRFHRLFYRDFNQVKLTLHKKIARYFGYEFVRTSQLAYRDINAHLIALFKQLDINCVLDVGANMGQFASNLRRAGYQGQIISFEPIMECFEHLKKHENKNWVVHNFALGNEEKTLDINITNKNVFSSFLKPNEYSVHRFNESAKVSRTQRVEVKRLDDIFNGIVSINNPRIFLKLDTQGFDLEVLKGAQQSLRHVFGLQSEISCKAIYAGMPTHVESLQYIDHLGYEVTDIYPLAHDKLDMSLLEFDCIFKRCNV